MCLTVTLALNEQVPRFPSQLLSRTSSLEATPTKRLFRTSPLVFTLAEKGQSCGCSLLAEDADWNALTWRLTPDARQRLAEVLKAVIEICPRGFSFQMIWIGDTVGSNEQITLSRLIEIVKSDEIGTHARYLVHSP